MPIRLVHIVDDDPEVLDSLCFMLRAEDFECARYPSAEAFLDHFPALEPGCVLVDLRLPGLNGLSLLARIQDMAPGYPVIIMTGHGDVTSAVTAMKAGAIDFLQKPFSKNDLLAALNAASAARDRPAALPQGRQLARDKVASLTRREQQVLVGLVHGHPNKTIAFDLGISPRTVEVHRANAMKKLAVQTLPDLLHIAFMAGLMEDDLQQV